jgi:hypothetical protein
MTRSTSKRRPLWRTGRPEGILILALLGLVVPSAQASPIRSYEINARGARDLRAWSTYLQGGSTLWSRIHAPHISKAVHVAMAQAMATNNPRANTWVQYLLWRHDRNPRRFDFYHPALGPALEALPPLKTIQPSSHPKPHPQTGGHPGKTPSPGILVPPGPTVPEPNTLTISLALLGAGCWYRWRVGPRPSRGSH